MPSALFERLKAAARRLQRDVVALYLAARDPRVPWLAKVVAGFVAAYALSPIDLIPDAIPILGYIDDLLIVPAGIAIAIRLIPPTVMAELRDQASAIAARPQSRTAAAVIVLCWIVAGALLTWWLATL